MEFFEYHPNKEYAPHEVWIALGWREKGIPLTSARRSFSNLSRPRDKKGNPITPKLIKTNNKVSGMYGMDTYTWKQNITKGQQSIF